MVALDHTHSAQGLGQPSRYLGIDAAALAEDRTDHSECLAQNKDKGKHKGERDEGDLGANAHQDEEGEHGGQHASYKIDQAGADQVAHAFHVGHDARHQHARAGGVVEADREPPDMLLYLHAQVGDQPLRRFRK